MYTKTTGPKSRERKTKKDWRPSCKHYLTCGKPEKEQRRCNARCCPGYKKVDG